MPLRRLIEEIDLIVELVDFGRMLLLVFTVPSLALSNFFKLLQTVAERLRHRHRLRDARGAFGPAGFVGGLGW